MATEEEDPVDPSDELVFLCLGGGNEVGRSCHIIQYKGKTVMVRSTTSMVQAGILTGDSLTPDCTRLTRGWLQCPSTTSLTSAP
jgi:hypothetical protein